MMRKAAFCFLAVFPFLFQSLSAFPQSTLEKETRQGRPYLKVGNEILYEGYFQLLGKFIPGFKQNFQTPNGRKKILDSIIEQELFLQKSRELGLLKNNPRLSFELFSQKRAIESSAVIYEEIDNRARKEYEKDKDRYFSQIEVADIVYLFKNTPEQTPEDQKKAVLAKAKETRRRLTPKNFAETASRESEDPIGKAQGGKIGPVSFIDQRVNILGWKPLVEAAFRLKKGKISEPIVTQEGAHLIMPVGEKQSQTYEDVGPYLREQLIPQVRKELVEQLKAEKKIEFLEPGLQPPETLPAR